MAEGDAAKRAFDEYLRRRADGEPVDIDVFCAERPHLAAGLRLLHSLHAAGSTASADGAPDDGANDTAAALEVLSPGDRVGHYLILRKLGGGGMGDVYLAEQQRPVQRQVALKIIKLGMDTREVIARFDAERQALALMDHPGIARIFDAGATVTGRPFFAMEFVDGAPITTFCDRERLDVATRLRLFLQVCRAVQHAHSKGILHRDLKPTNVLVSPVDGEPTARVIDFGIAKATDRRLTERTLATELGTAVGTPAYMSPEQTRLSSEVDARSDVYSLGVILYELLIGDLPLDWTSPQAAGLEEVLHRIREEDPPTPSTRWLRLDAGETRARAARRGIDSPHLLRELRGDLDWITMRALEKEPDRRYATAADLAADIERFLDGEPVAARPPSAIYRAQKFIRRYRVAVTAVAAVIAALVAGLVASLLLYVEAEDRLARALQQTYLANITAAGDRLEESNSAEARRRLAACPESLRGWEWRHLDLKRDTSLARLSDGGDSLAVAVGPDGRIAATGNDRGTVRIWNAIDGTSLRTVECGPANVDSIHISSDGERIIAGFSDGSVRTWRADPWTPLAVIKTTASSAWSADASRVASGTDDGRIDVRDTGTGALILSAQAHTDRVSTVALDADGRSVVFASVDRTVRVLDVETGEIVVLAGHVGAITALDVTPAGDRVASASADRTVRIWDVAAAQVLSVLPHPHGASFIDLSDDGSHVVTGAEGAEGSVRLETWHAEKGEMVARLTPWLVSCVAWSPDGRQVALGSLRGGLRLWRPRIRKTTTLLGHEATVTAVSFSADGQRVVSASRDGTARVWHAFSDGVTKELREHEGEPRFLAVAPRSGRIISASTGEVLIRDAATGEVTQRALRPEGEIASLSVSPDDERIALGLVDGTIRIELASSAGTERVLRGHEREVTSLAFAADGKRLVSASLDGTVRVWESGKAVTVLGHAGIDEFVSVAVAGRTIAAGCRDGTTRLWHDTGRDAAELRGHAGPVVGVALFDRGRQLVTASTDGTLRLGDARSGETSALLRGHAGPVRAVAVTPDGKRILSGSDDRTICVWDAATGVVVATLRGARGAITAVAATPDGRRVISASSAGTVRIWESDFADARTVWQVAAVRSRMMPLLRRLFSRHIWAARVIDHLESRPDLDDEERRTAIRMARFREHHPAVALNNESWAVVVGPDRPHRDYELALRKATAACRLDPENHFFLNTLALARYRSGLIPEALEALSRARELNRAAREGYHGAVDSIIAALCRNRLGDTDRARSELRRAVTLMVVDGVELGPGSKSVLVEAMLTRVPDATINLGRGVSGKRLRLCVGGDGRTTEAGPDDTRGRRCRANDVSGQHPSYFYFDLDAAFTPGTPVAVTVEYLDAGGSWFTLEYDSQDESPSLNGRYKRADQVWMHGSGDWQRYTFFIDDAHFGSRQNLGADFRLDPERLLRIGRVAVMFGEAPPAR